MELGGLADDLAVASLALARRFARGGTLWCVAPAWPAHGRHVAVEFVHPVIMGKRALPAAFVDAGDVTSELHVLARPGDVVLAVSTAGDADVAATMRLGPTWGVTTLWLGAGAAPAAGAADHLLWLAGEEVPLHDGRMVLLYHLLWELTHVCFEHPGLLRDDDARVPG